MEVSVYTPEELAVVPPDADMEGFPMLALSDSEQIAATVQLVAVSVSRKAALNIRGFAVNAGVVLVGSTAVFGIWLFAIRLFA